MTQTEYEIKENNQLVDISLTSISKCFVSLIVIFKSLFGIIYNKAVDRFDKNRQHNSQFKLISSFYKLSNTLYCVLLNVYY